MLRKFTLVLSLIFVMGCFTHASATAQGTPATDSPVTESTEHEYSRTFMPGDTLLTGTPAPDGEVADDKPYLISTSIVIFENPEQAQAGIDILIREFRDVFPEADTSEPVEYDDVGDQAIMFHIEPDGMPSTAFAVRESEYLYFASVAGGDANAGKDQARALVGFMLDGEIENEEVTFNSDGTSTGGAFDLMPTLEDAGLISNLPVAMDFMHPMPDVDPSA